MIIFVNFLFGDLFLKQCVTPIDLNRLLLSIKHYEIFAAVIACAFTLFYDTLALLLSFSGHWVMFLYAM